MAIIKIIILLLVVAGRQYLIRKLVDCLNKRIDESDKHIRAYLASEEGKKEIKEKGYKTADFYKESTGLFLIKKKKEKLNFITTIIGVIEVVLFGGLTFILIQENYDFYKIFVILTPLIVGWIALKIFGSYRQWSGAVFGRSCFYIFFIGSIFNIVIAVIIGLMASKLF